MLPEAAELGDIPGDLLARETLPDLWSGDEITVQDVMNYFGGKTLVMVDKGGVPRTGLRPQGFRRRGQCGCK